jgi:hypothetical protein
VLENLSKGAIQAGLAIDTARQLESALEALGATGKGLHEKVSSVESTLPEALVTKLRFIASVRNKIVHEDELLSEEEISVFVESGKQAVEALGAAGAKDKPAKTRSRANPRKRGKPRQAPTQKRKTPAQIWASIRLGVALVLAGIVLVFLLMVLGNDGSVLWIGAFSTYFLLGWYFLKRLRRASA